MVALAYYGLPEANPLQTLEPRHTALVSPSTTPFHYLLDNIWSGCVRVVVSIGFCEQNGVGSRRTLGSVPLVLLDVSILVNIGVRQCISPCRQHNINAVLRLCPELNHVPRRQWKLGLVFRWVGTIVAGSQVTDTSDTKPGDGLRIGWMVLCGLKVSMG